MIAARSGIFWQDLLSAGSAISCNPNEAASATTSPNEAVQAPRSIRSTEEVVSPARLAWRGTVTRRSLRAARSASPRCRRAAQMEPAGAGVKEGAILDVGRREGRGACLGSQGRLVRLVSIGCRDLIRE